jgi:hypothetical protein
MLTPITRVDWDRLTQVCQVLSGDTRLCDVYQDTRTYIFIAEVVRPSQLFYKIPAHNETVESLLRELLPEETLPATSTLPHSQRRIMSSTFAHEFERLGAFELLLDSGSDSSSESGESE